MRKLVAIFLIMGSQTSCSVLNSHAAAARELRDGGPGPVFYCWRRGAGNYSGSCLHPEEGLDKDLWGCAHKLATTGKILQKIEVSRSEMITCMHEKGWQEFEVRVSG